MIDHPAIDRIASEIRTLNAALYSLDSDSPPVVVVVGAFSRGKSALINALLGQSILPVHPLPATAVPTRIAYAEVPSARLVYADHADQVMLEGTQSIFAYRTPTPDLCEIQIGWPSALLQSGLVLLDTPGIDAQPSPLTPLPVREGNAALIFVFAADPPLGEVELDFLREVAPSVPRIVLVQTKCDTLPDSDLQAATAFNRAAIDSVCPALKAIPIVSVSALTGAGIPTLRAIIAGWDSNGLRRERVAWQTEAIQHRLHQLTDQLDVQRTHLETIGAVFDSARDICIADLETIHAGTLATLARFSEYALGNLSAAIYRAEPIELTGGRGLTLANSELRRLRDQLTSEIERALLASRRRLIESLTAASLPANTLPEPPALVLRDPRPGTVAVRIRERRVFLPKQLDAGQTTNAYRTAVAHMADAYAAELLPAIERYLTGYRTALIDSLSKPGQIPNQGRSIE